MLRLSCFTWVKAGKEFGHGDDVHASEACHRKQVGVATDDDIGVAVDRGLEDAVVVRVAAGGDFDCWANEFRCKRDFTHNAKRSIVCPAELRGQNAAQFLQQRLAHDEYSAIAGEFEYASGFPAKD